MSYEEFSWFILPFLTFFETNFEEKQQSAINYLTIAVIAFIIVDTGCVISI